MYQPRSAIVLDTRKPLQTHPGKGSVKLRITFRQGAMFKQFYYPLKIYLTKKEFETILKSPKNAIQRSIKEEIQLIETKAWKTCQLKGVFDRRTFEAVWFGNADGTLKSYFNRKVKALIKQGRVGSANAYTNAINSLLRYHGPHLLFSDINYAWLEGYETYMLNQGRSISTIGMNLRALRAIFNEAIHNGETNAELYPFKNYTIKTERKIKIPVNPADVALLKAYAGNNKPRRKAVALWLFSYYNNGMNLNDILLLKWSQVSDGFIVYRRNKSRRTSTDIRDIVIPLRDEVREIMREYGNPGGQYVFNYLEAVTDPETRKRRIHHIAKNLNTQLKKVAEELGIKKLTNSLARHTFSNTLLNAGVGKEFIQYALGHTDMKTTENYLAGFSVDKLKQASGYL